MRPSHPPGRRPPVIARCLSGSAFSENRVLSEVDALGQRSTILHRWTNSQKVARQRRILAVLSLPTGGPSERHNLEEGSCNFPWCVTSHVCAQVPRRHSNVNRRKVHEQDDSQVDGN